MNLLIDIGNTRNKWAVEKSGKFIENGFIENFGTGSHLAQVCRTKSLSRVLVGSVAGEKRNKLVKSFLSEISDIDVEFVKVAKEFAGLTVAYQHVGSLGVDRWLGMLGAWKKYRSAFVVIDAGSALTVDFVNDNGLHEGGLIVPGVSMMREALFSRTDAVKLGAVDLVAKWKPGGDTLTCVENGVSAVVKGFLSEVRRKASGKQFVLTGGDAYAIRVFLDGSSEVEEHLVFNGLRSLL